MMAATTSTHQIWPETLPPQRGQQIARDRFFNVAIGFRPDIRNKMFKHWA
jgi:hypothetical protein